MISKLCTVLSVDLNQAFLYFESINIEGHFWQVNAPKYFQEIIIFICDRILRLYIRRAMRNEGNNDSKHWLSELPFTKTNYILFIAGLFVIILGYVFMATGELNSTRSLTVAPIVLLVGYLVIIPISIMYKKKD